MTQRFGMTVKTRLSFDELENVVAQHCQGEFSISLGGLDDSGAYPRKIMLVWFTQLEDRDRVRRFFDMRTGKESSVPGKPMPKSGAAAA